MLMLCASSPRLVHPPVFINDQHFQRLVVVIWGDSLLPSDVPPCKWLMPMAMLLMAMLLMTPVGMGRAGYERPMSLAKLLRIFSGQVGDTDPE